MVLEGGLRDRMVFESVLEAIKADLIARGWFAAGRWHKPILIVDEFPDSEAEVALNTLAFSLGDTVSREFELGSKAELLTVPMYVDFFAESDGVGRHVVGDIHSYVQVAGQFPVFDYRQPTPPVEFIVQLVEGTIERSKPSRAVNTWQKNWHVVSFVLHEERANV